MKRLVLVLSVLVAAACGKKPPPAAPANTAPSGETSPAASGGSPEYQKCLQTGEGLSPPPPDWASLSQADKESECSVIDADANMPLGPNGE